MIVLVFQHDLTRTYQQQSPDINKHVDLSGDTMIPSGSPCYLTWQWYICDGLLMTALTLDKKITTG